MHGVKNNNNEDVKQHPNAFFEKKIEVDLNSRDREVRRHWEKKIVYASQWIDNVHERGKKIYEVARGVDLSGLVLLELTIHMHMPIYISNVNEMSISLTRC